MLRVSKREVQPRLVLGLTPSAVGFAVFPVPSALQVTIEGGNHPGIVVGQRWTIRTHAFLSICSNASGSASAIALAIMLILTFDSSVL